MTIYILDSDPQKTAQCLDDRSLNFMIKDIARVLCDVHHDLIDDNFFESSKYSKHCENMKIKWKSEIPLDAIYVSKNGLLQWSKWARQYKANYLYLIELAEICSRELNFRFEGLTEKQINKEKILIWARNNLPDLPLSGCQCYEEDCPLDLYQTSPFPLVMPKKYIVKVQGAISEEDNIIVDYRNYYKLKLKKRMNHPIINGVSSHVACVEKGSCLHKIIWTNREKPEWLNF